MRIKIILLLLVFFKTVAASAQQHTLLEYGQGDNSGQGFSLFPDRYSEFIAHDFGFEDRIFWEGFHTPASDIPYILPGPENGWGGTGPTAGIRSHFLNFGFELDQPASTTGWLVIDLVDTDSIAALLKVTVNDSSWNFDLKPGTGLALEQGRASKSAEQLIEVELPKGLLRDGFNRISLTTLEGGWIVFDRIALTAPTPITVRTVKDLVVEKVVPAAYETLSGGGKIQPLLVAVSHIQHAPLLKVSLDGEQVFSQVIETGKHLFEVPMEATDTDRTSNYQVLVDDKIVKEGKIARSPQELQGLGGYVNTLLGTAHSRWMIAPGPWMPFGMVKLSPDNQNPGWQAGYDPTFESIGTFSHIHEWTMTGLGTFPTSGDKIQTTVGDQSDPESGYRSRFDKKSEKAGLGHYQAHLTDTDIIADLTATNRASFQKYTYQKGDTGRIMIDLTIPSEYGYQVEKCEITKVSANRIEGFSHQLTPNVWSEGVGQEYVVHFVIEFDQPVVNFSTWENENIAAEANLAADRPKKAGAFVEFDLKRSKTVQLRTGISYVSIANAAENLQTEISDPFGWHFQAVVDHHQQVWEELFSRVKVSSHDAQEKERFYTNMYRTLASRNTFSDVDGSWVDADENIQQFEDPNDLALGCDAFWNTFWNLNQFWNLVTPEWSNQWVKSQLAMYDNAGWLAKGPTGMEYIPVMVAEHEIPLIVGAYQMGIRDYDAEKAFEAVVKMQTTPAEKVGGGLAGNRDLETYLKHQYVPYDEGRFSNSLEYSYDDWTVSQFAKALGKEDAYQVFADRGNWWKNVIDPETGYARMKDADGNWLEDFDPFTSGANHHYVEGNAWQLTFFVPQDVPGLIETIGRQKFLDRLEWGFQESNRWRFNGPNDQYWDYPVVQGNQQSMHFAFLFNYAGKPWLTQQWSRAILDRYYGYEVTNAYLGDEDQGQMSAWFMMASLGLFQIDGGARVDPVYEIGSPVFEKTEIKLGNDFGRQGNFIIRAENTSRKNKYVQKAFLNGKPLNQFWFPVKEILQGGELILEMGPEPNTQWGTGPGPTKN